MKKLLLPLIVAVLAALFASSKPDGLERVAGMLGFSQMAKESAAVMSGYSVHFLGSSRFSVVIASMLGVIIVYSLFLFFIYLLKKRGC
jgi:cobalt/nickel transport protein